MEGYFFHATGRTVALLKSKAFHGSNKQAAKLGEEYKATAKDSDLFFMAGRLGEHPIAAGLGRIKAKREGDVRSILVFSDPNNKVSQLMSANAMSREQQEFASGGGYYVLTGREIPISEVRLGMIIGIADDLPAVPADQDAGTAFYMGQISKYVSRLEYFAVPLAAINDAKIRACLTEAIAHGCFA